MCPKVVRMGGQQRADRENAASITKWHGPVSPWLAQHKEQASKG